MKFTRSIQCGRRAFTLLELMLAIGVMAIVLVAINGVFFSAMRLHERTVEAIDNAQPLQQALLTLRRDIEGAMPPYSNGVFSGDFKVGAVTSTGLNQPVSFELYTTTGAMRDDVPWSEVQRVTYELRSSGNISVPGQDLVRKVTRNILATVTPQPEEQWMAGGIRDIEITCFDGTQWRPYWDTTTTDTNLPSAVRVRLRMATDASANSQPVEIVVPIDAQPRTTVTTNTAGQ